MATDSETPDGGCGTDAARAPANNGHKPVRALLIDDDRDDYLLTRELVADLGGRFTLDWAGTYGDGLKAICSGTHDVYLLDYRLGARTGIEMLREAHARGCVGPIILLTGQGQSRTDLEALDAGADDYLEKAGLSAALLERSIRYALAQHRAAAELERKVESRTAELGKANDALRDVDRRKDEFLSTLGHELRNPLAPILNALEIIRLSGDNPEMIARQRERMERQVGQMARLVDDLLDVSRITTGKLRLSLEPMSLREVVEAALEISRPNVEKARLTLNVDIPAGDVPLSGDKIRMAQVFSNLLNNAAKYTEPGGRVSVIATVKTSLKAEDGLRRTEPAAGDAGQNSDSAIRHPPSAFVQVRIRDTGVGISAELLPRIFELFTQVDRSLNRSQGGLGVGLALVRRLVELHGGRVAVASDGPWTGAEFTVELPVAQEV